MSKHTDTRVVVSDLAKLGLCVEEVAARAGISARHARRLLVELGVKEPGIKWPAVPAPTIAKMHAMVEDGCSFREIARTTGVRWETVERHFPGRQWTKAQAASHGQLLRTVSLP